MTSKNIQTELLQLIQHANHQQNIEVYNGKVSLSSANGMAVYADSSPAPTMDADGRDGWLFTKTVADASKFNYYFYSEGNKAVTLNQIHSLCANISMDTYPSSTSTPFFIIYTKPTGVGDAGAWYHSRIIYTLDANETILLGEDIEIYSIHSQANHHQNKRPVSFNTKIVDGDGASTEEIYTISIHSDSASLASTQILVTSVGFSIKQNNKIINRRISLN